MGQAQTVLEKTNLWYLWFHQHDSNDKWKGQWGSLFGSHYRNRNSFFFFLHKSVLEAASLRESSVFRYQVKQRPTSQMLQLSLVSLSHSTCDPPLSVAQTSVWNSLLGKQNNAKVSQMKQINELIINHRREKKKTMQCSFIIL